MRWESRCRVLLSITAIALLAASPAAHAYSSSDSSTAQPRSVGFLLRMGFDFGGDKLTTVTWSDNTSADIKGGQLITFAAGAIYRPAEASYALEATLGYKFDKANGSNGSIGFTRIPLDVIASLAYGGHRIGVGPTVHFAPNFGCHASGICSSDTSFDTALGGVAQYAINFFGARSTGLEVGLRYTYIRYKHVGLATLDGSGPGFFFGGSL